MAQEDGCANLGFTVAYWRFVDFHEELCPILRGELQKEFENLRLLVRFTHDIDARNMLRRIANDRRALARQEIYVYSERQRSTFVTIVRLRLRMGIRQRGAAATRCRCRMTKASVSRFGFGSCWSSVSIFSCLIESDSSSITVAKDFHSALVNKGSDNERRKSFTTPQIRWISW